MKYLALFLFVFISFGASAKQTSKLPKEVHIITLPFPPYMNSDESGMAVIFLKKAFQGMGIKAKFSFLPPKRALDAFFKGEGLLISSFGPFEEGDYTMLRLAVVRAGLYQLQNNLPSKKSAYLRGVKRGHRAIVAQGLEPFPVSNYAAGLKMLATGRVGSFLAQNLPLNYLLSHSKDKSSPELHLVRNGIYQEAGGLIAGPKDLYILKALRDFISTEKMRKIYREVAQTELSPYLGIFEMKDYIWDDFKLIELKDNVVELSN